ncbi:hypothetical protein L7F22_029755 [Adiantum nelumboides]|nr:hypothetical protein [Adiantum nelumboides]
MFDSALSSPSRLPFLKGINAQQNAITCAYETKLAGLCRHVTVTWVRSAKGHGLCVTVDDPSLRYTCKVRMNPWSFWKKQGVKSFEVCGSKVEVYWDLSSARYICGPEPQWGFYVAVVCNREVVLLLGDKCSEAYKKTRARPSIIDATLVSRKEHIFGKKIFCTKAPFIASGKVHDITIECETNVPKEPYLCIKIDAQLVVHVRNLEWKFRGNQTVVVDGITMQVFWDVYNWLFSSGGSNAVFIFQACSGSGGGSHKAISNKIDGFSATVKWSGDLNGSISVMKLSNARSLRAAHDLLGFTGSSLVLNAWKSE